MSKREDDSKLERLAFVLDDLFRIPGTSIRIGLDPLLGLIPGVGDLLTSFLSYAIVYRAAQRGASPFILAAMIKNILVDALVGLVPFLGDLSDFVVKANRKNFELLREVTATSSNPPRTASQITNTLLTIGVIAVVSTMLVALGSAYIATQMWSAVNT